MSTEPITIEAFDLAALNDGNRGRMLADPEIERRVEALLARMTLEQKLAQMYGSSLQPVNDLYLTPGQPELGIPALKMVDGPRGVRAGTATTFPAAIARGAAWDLGLECRVGQAIAREARVRGANVLLAPAINLLRHPAWGRAQETYGEDSLHVGRLGVAFIAGAQRELVASVKHFALNSIEDTRFDVDVLADARTLREVYLPHFELCVRAAHVGSVMSAYNKVNGLYCAENPALLREILRGEWGFRGFVESDWIFGTRSTLGSLQAGLDIEMPQANYYGHKLYEAAHEQTSIAQAVEEAARRVLRVKLAFGLDSLRELDPELVECHEHLELALEAARKSIVLLKNERELLPLAPQSLRKLAVVGALSDVENTGDRGSSAVQSSYVITPLEGIRDHLHETEIVHVPRDVLSEEDRRAIRAADATIVVVGLTWREEGENIPLTQGGGDRDSLRLPRQQEELVKSVCALNARTVVVLEAGSAIEVRSFVDEVPALLMLWYPGMLGGEALADVLFGRVSPSGKLPITFARSSDDLVPFDHVGKSVPYGLYHGYRELDRTGKEPEFSFGYGLSYTRFSYGRLTLDRELIAPSESVSVSVDVTNVGSRAGDEIVQLYLRVPASSIERPVRMLVGFGRVPLLPGETKRLCMRVSTAQLAYYDERSQSFRVEATEYELEVGSSSRDILLRTRFRVA